MKYVLFLILSLSNFANAATVMEWQEATFTNLLKNPGFENGSAKWTPSVSATFRIVSGTQALIETRSASFTATAASQTVQSALYALPKGLINSDCESQILYQTNSNVYRMRVLNASGAVIAQQPLPAVSSSSVAKMFFPCSISGTTSVRSDLISSATAGVNSITWDQNHLGSLISFKTGAVAESDRPYGLISVGAVTTAPTKGGTTIDSVVGNRIGDNIFFTLDYRQTSAGVAGSGDYLYSLPQGLSFNLNKVTAYTGATTALTTPAVQTSLLPTSGGFTDNTNGAFAIVSVYSATQYRIITLISGNSGAFHSSTNSPYSNTNLAFKINFRAPISGLTGSSTTFDFACPNDISCQDSFSFKVSSTGVVTEENLDIVNGNCGIAGNTFTCTWNPGVFPNGVTCVGSEAGGGLNQSLSTGGATSTSFIYATTLNGAGAALGASIVCNRTNNVAKRTVEGFLSKTVTSTGNFIERMERLSFGGAANDTTNCTTSPCTIHRQSGGILSVGRGGQGLYTISFVTGTFSAPPTCTGNGYNNTVASIVTPISRSSSSYSFATVAIGGATNNDSWADITCIGPR